MAKTYQYQFSKTSDLERLIIKQQNQIKILEESLDFWKQSDINTSERYAQLERDYKIVNITLYCTFSFILTALLLLNLYFLLK